MDKTVKQIAADAGLSLRGLARRFDIPQRTMENWSAGARSCPPYVLRMMQECLGQYATTENEKEQG